MRTIIALAFTALTVASAQAGYYRGGEFREPCNDLPPLSARAEPTERYKVVTLPSEEVQIRCGGPFERVATACARWVDPKSAAAGWVIFIDDNLPARDFRCVLIYEKAHLPPNNWVDHGWERYIKTGN